MVKNYVEYILDFSPADFNIISLFAFVFRMQTMLKDKIFKIICLYLFYYCHKILVTVFERFIYFLQMQTNFYVLLAFTTFEMHFPSRV